MPPEVVMVGMALGSMPVVVQVVPRVQPARPELPLELWLKVVAVAVAVALELLAVPVVMVLVTQVEPVVPQVRPQSMEWVAMVAMVKAR